MSERCIRAWISGRVQGVFFRASARERAMELGISGYARNLHDGRVEVLASGDEASVDRFIEWLHKGPDEANVVGVDIEPGNDAPQGSFAVK